MESIKLTNETYQRLLRQAQSFEDDPETVIDRLLTAAEAGTSPAESPPPRAATKDKRAMLPESEYWVPILRYLAKEGGAAPSAAVVEAVGAQLDSRLTEADRDRVKSGELRWQNRARFARLRMREMGLLSDSSPRGIWEITEGGYTYLEDRDPEG